MARNGNAKAQLQKKWLPNNDYTTHMWKIPQDFLMMEICKLRIKLSRLEGWFILIFFIYQV